MVLMGRSLVLVVLVAGSCISWRFWLVGSCYFLRWIVSSKYMGESFRCGMERMCALPSFQMLSRTEPSRTGLSGCDGQTSNVSIK